MSKSDRIRLVVVIAVIFLALLSLLWPTKERTYKGFAAVFQRIKLGLDIRGGARLEYRVDIKENVENPADVVDNVLMVLRNRLDSAGYTEATLRKVFRENNAFIVVEIPGVNDTTAAEKLIGSTGVLYFAQVLDETNVNPETDPRLKDLARIKRATWLPAREGNKWYLVREEIMLIRDLKLVSPRIVSASPVPETRVGRFGYKVTFELSKEDAEIFKRITQQLVVSEAAIGTPAAAEKRLAIVLDDVVQFAGYVVSVIPDGKAEITGNFSLEEARRLAAILRSGALPARLEKVSAGWVAPLLGSDIIRASFIAGIVGLILVLIYMVAFYGVQGIIADIALIYNTILLLGILAATGSILTLPGIAGILFTIGTTVDGNIIIIERIKEELRLGKSIKAAIATAFERSFITLFDANLTTIIAGLVLYYFGTGTVKGFAITLIIGVIGSFFVNIVLSRVLTDALSSFIRKPAVEGEGAKS
ncbi:protein translocase subunit SecD [Pseudothermotoga thermarum]|uniref:Protein translocase subunit SecD n=1 Tax=Pseudothermotoga thermarum DSM 5069 TaxID=688269 RepID=F7YW35_9THEM|nr:protein translocase subunit SecD [Pseudothermotoga thermarum]AEH50523.1 protein-export membrane protein SecD [Pseudothermotoga thermarum DSM 5069]